MYGMRNVLGSYLQVGAMEGLKMNEGSFEVTLSLLGETKESKHQVTHPLRVEQSELLGRQRFETANYYLGTTWCQA